MPLTGITQASKTKNPLPNNPTLHPISHLLPYPKLYQPTPTQTSHLSISGLIIAPHLTRTEIDWIGMPKKSSKELFELLLRDTENHVVDHIRKTMGEQYLRERRLGQYKPKTGGSFQLDVATIGDWPPVKQQPASLTNCTMREYQVQGLNWLIRLYRTGLNGILADEMGLGKTLQTISLLAYLHETNLSKGPHLVLVPLTTISNWLREFKRFCPSLEVIRFHGDPNYRAEMVDHVISKGKFDVCITTYEMASREKNNLKKINWSYIIVDEAHRLKNENSLLSRVLREYRSSNRLLITGTPLQNTLKDVWSLLNFLLPSIFNNSDDFDSLFQSVENDAGVVRIGKKSTDGDGDDDDDDDDDLDAVEAEELAKKEHDEEERRAFKQDQNNSNSNSTSTSTLTTSATSHRTSRKANDDDDAMSLALKKQQERDSERQKHADHARLNTTKDGDDNIENDVDDEFKSQVLGKLHTILRPFVLRRLKADVATDLPPKKEIYIHIPMTQLQRKVYHDIIIGNFDSLGGVTKQRQKLLNVVIQLRKCCNHPYLFDGIEDESLPALGEHLITTSGKMVILDKLLKKLFSTGEATAIPANQSKVLIFCQMTTQLNILEDYCNYRGYPSCRIDGSTDSYRREELMEEFNRPGSPKQVFLLSTRAGGVGINLVAADTVILYDSDWNPQMDLQAMDRAHRLGQTRPVNVYRFIIKDSIEERVMMRAEAKLRLDQMVIQSGRTPTSNNAMSSTDMVDLIRSGVNNIFSADDSDSLDEDIDLILTRGEDKTKELTSKLEKFKGFELSLSAPVTNDHKMADGDGDDGLREGESTAEQNQRLREMLGHTAVDNDINQQLQKEHEAYLAQLSKEEDELHPNKRLTNRSQYEQERYFLQLFADAKAEIPQPMMMRYQRIHECQLYNYPRLEEINQIEQDLYDKFISDAQSYAKRSLQGEELKEPDFKNYILSPQLVTEREKILTDGFPTWSFFEYKAFIRGNEKYGRNAYDLIAQEIGSKSGREVKIYSTAFFSRYLWIKDGKKVVAGIELAETKVFAANALVPYLTPMVDHLHSPFDAQVRFSGISLASNKSKAYTDEIDGLCLYTVARDGFQANSIKDSVMLSSSLSFDYFARTRLPADLYRRVETIGRQFAPKTLQKKRGGPPSKKPAQDVTGSALATLAGIGNASRKPAPTAAGNTNGAVETKQDLDEDGNPITVDMEGNIVQAYKRRPTRHRNNDVSYLE